MNTRAALQRAARRAMLAPRRLTAGSRGLPDALIIGAQKAGTTSLFQYLVQHPSVLAPAVKEVHYFDLNFERGERWYRAHFPRRGELAGGMLTVDASPYYLVHPLAPERAAATLPRAKLIALVRNPVDRAWSHHQHEIRAGRETLSFEEAVDRESERTDGAEQRLRDEPGHYDWNHHRYTYLRRGQYVDQLERWVEQFGREQLLVLQSEWLFEEPVAATAEVCRFLGLPDRPLERYEAFYAGGYTTQMPAELRARLVEHFEPFNRDLYRWIGRELDWS